MCKTGVLVPDKVIETPTSSKSIIQNSKVMGEEVLGEFGLKKWKAPQGFAPFSFIPYHIWNFYFMLLPAHIGCIYGLSLRYRGLCEYHYSDLLFMIIYGYAGGIGVTAGAHRLWTHKSYKASKALQWALMLMQTSTIQYPVIKWCRDHRIHHKYTDTNADPHSAARGFWFSHLGWIINPEHPEVARKEKQIPMDDLENNPILDFQARHYWKLVFLTAFVIPISFHWYFMPSPFLNIVAINYVRWVFMTHLSSCINSVAHIFGDRPFDKNQSAVENRFMAILTVGEAWHNFHHSFPQDYKTSELPFYTFNVSTLFIDFCGYMGHAWDMKTVTQEMIDDRAKRTGDGSHPSCQKIVDDKFE